MTLAGQHAVERRATLDRIPICSSCHARCNVCATKGSCCLASTSSTLTASELSPRGEEEDSPGAMTLTSTPNGQVGCEEEEASPLG